MQVRFSRTEGSLQINEQSNSDSVHAILEGKYQQIISMELFFICVLVYLAPGYMVEDRLMKMKSFYTYLLAEINESHCSGQGDT